MRGPAHLKMIMCFRLGTQDSLWMVKAGRSGLSGLSVCVREGENVWLWLWCVHTSHTVKCWCSRPSSTRLLLLEQSNSLFELVKKAESRGLDGRWTSGLTTAVLTMQAWEREWQPSNYMTVWHGGTCITPPIKEGEIERDRQVQELRLQPVWLKGGSRFSEKACLTQ